MLNRTRGVLQGFPLSPYVLSIFPDGLVVLVSEGADRSSFCLSYTDDGVIHTPASFNTQTLLDTVSSWS